MEGGGLIETFIRAERKGWRGSNRINMVIFSLRAFKC